MVVYSKGLCKFDVGCVIHIHFSLQIRILDTIMVVEEMKLQAVINGCVGYIFYFLSLINYGVVSMRGAFSLRNKCIIVSDLYFS